MYKCLVKTLAWFIVKYRKISNLIKKYKEDAINFTVSFISVFILKISLNIKELIKTLSFMKRDMLSDTIVYIIATVFFMFLLASLLKAFDNKIIRMFFKILINTFISIIFLEKPLILTVILIVIMPAIVDFMLDVYIEYFKEIKDTCY